MPKHIEAMNREETHILARETWRHLNDEEMKTLDYKNIIPIVLLFTNKRCGKAKCRAVVLGNRVTKDSVDCYASVATLAGVRY